MSEVAQKAKIKWVIEGDEKTKFFHGMLNKKRNQRSIQGIMVNGTWIDEPVKRDDLERMVTKEEVEKAVWDCGSDKSPGPDGFSFSFFRHFWSTIEKDIFEAVDCFFTNGDMPNGFLECFYRASGLRINMCKNKIMGVNLEDKKIQNAASKLGYLVFKTPFTYLGTKVGENMSRKEAWKEVVDKVLLRLSKWKTKTLSIGAIHGDDGKLDKDVIVGAKLVGRGVIKESFPRLYALELHKHATVRMKLMAPSLNNSFRRRVRSGAEESEFNSLLVIVQVINLVPCEDRYFWSLEREGDYSVASIRKLIDEKRFQE
nr:RNA-directed DNA polymerase, eukaryota, reverse transcriptase zinc-binding domain protein [Tanacetum cinerariifolium]